MKQPDRKSDQSAETARKHAEADVNTSAEVEGAAAAMHESERRSPSRVASQARSAQEAKASAEGKDGHKDNPPSPPKRPGNFTGEAVNLTTDTPPTAWQGQDGSGGQADTLEDTQERSDTMASRIHPDNRFRDEQEAENEVDENINTDPTVLEESGELSSPPGPSVSRRENT